MKKLPDSFDKVLEFHFRPLFEFEPLQEGGIDGFTQAVYRYCERVLTGGQVDKLPTGHVSVVSVLDDGMGPFSNAKRDCILGRVDELTQVLA